MSQLPEDRFVADHVRGLPKSGIREFFAIVAQNPDAISLGVGEPDFVTPWRIREAAIFALEEGRTSYTDNRGTKKLREAISDYTEDFFGLAYDPDDEVIVTVGVSEAIDIALRAVINPGDKVLYHEPCYVSYHPTVTLTHGQAIPVRTRREDNFALDPDALKAAWEPGCKVLMLNFPTNPTGGTIDRERLQAIADFAIEKDLLVLSDEIYAEMVFEGRHQTIAGLPGMRERTILLHGVSKAFAMTGFRLGFACAPPHLVEAMLKVHQYSMLCAPILSQEAAVEAFRHGTPAMEKMRASYHKRRDFVCRRFQEMGLACPVPEATFYTFPSVESTGLNERDFALKLLEEEEVAVVPGTAFGEAGAGSIRACFATSYERLIEATDRMERFVQRHQR